MALQKCHECKKKVSMEAATCPACGAPVKVEPKSESSGWGCFTLLIIAVLIILIFNYFDEKERERFDSLTPEQQQKELAQKAKEKLAEEKREAYLEKERKKKEVAENFAKRCDKEASAFTYLYFVIEESLTDPGSLDMSLFDAKVIPFSVKDDLNCHWKINGTFDAQNAFGGTLRKKYISTIHYYYKTDKWKLGSLEIK